MQHMLKLNLPKTCRKEEEKEECQKEEEMTTCKNCGHSSHCGIPLIKDVRTHAELNDGHSETEQIEVCKKCCCKKCMGV